MVSFTALSSMMIVAALGCSKSPPVRDETGQRGVTEAQAGSIAQRKARQEGYDLKLYRQVSIEREVGGSFDNQWRVWFEHVPPAPPGGHFTVYVDAVSGAAKLIHGR